MKTNFGAEELALIKKKVKSIGIKMSEFHRLIGITEHSLYSFARRGTISSDLKEFLYNKFIFGDFDIKRLKYKERKIDQKEIQKIFKKIEYKIRSIESEKVFKALG